MSCTIASAIAETAVDPSPAQREAGNYKKGKIRLHGLPISIENPRGSKRRPEWKPLAHHYGYINRTEGRDGDHVDVFIGPKPSSELVFVVDQVSPSGKRFDEHKVLLGFTNEKDAWAGYLANYPAGWKCGPITAMTIQQFKAWLAKGDTKRRVAEQVNRYDKQAGVPTPSAAPAPTPGGQPAAGPQRRVGETKTVNGTTYRLNENHRWELADGSDPTAQQPGGQTSGQQANPQPKQPAPSQPNPADDQAARNKFVAGKLGGIDPEISGLMRAIHESPHFQQSGEYVSFDVHKRVAGQLYQQLGANVGSDFGGGQVVDLSQGRVGFASEAGSIVVWPADEQGRHQISYTNKTGIVGRAMQGQPQEGEKANGLQSTDKTATDAAGNDAANPNSTAAAPAAEEVGEEPILAEAIDEQEPEPPPLPGESGNPFAQSPRQPRSSEQAYRDHVGPSKPKHPHEQLRKKANAAKQRMDEALAAFEQATVDGESRKTRLRLKNRFAEMERIYNHHNRQATAAEREHKQRLKASGKDTRERMKEKGIGPFAGKGAAPKGGQPAGQPSGEPKPAKEKKSGKPAKQPLAEPETPLIDHAEQNAGQGDVPSASPESLEIGKLPIEAQRAASSAQTFLKTSGLAVTPANHKAIQHAFRRGWIKDRRELRTMLRRAKKLHERGGGQGDDHAALREAIRRKANRERRISWAATVKQKASEWDMSPKEFHDTASEIYKAYTEHHDEREAAKAHARKASGLSAKDINKLENEGFDHGSDHPKVKGLDTLGREMAEMYPGLGWQAFGDSVGSDSGDHDQKVWELLREGTAKKKPSKTSPEFMQHLEEFLQRGLSQGGGGAPMTDEERREMEAIPFAKRREGVVQRYRAWSHLNFAYGKTFDPQKHPRDRKDGKFVLAGRSHAKMQKRFTSRISSVLSNSRHLSDSSKAIFQKGIDALAEKLPMGWLRRIKRNAASIHFYETWKEITQEYFRRTQDPNLELEAFYDPTDASLHLNGSELRHDDPNDIARIYVHELAHSLDRNDVFCDSEEWRSIWNDEIIGKLGLNADRNRFEGWADFGVELVFNVAQAKSDFPRAYKFWKSKGLTQ